MIRKVTEQYIFDKIDILESSISEIQCGLRSPYYWVVLDEAIRIIEEMQELKESLEYHRIINDIDYPKEIKELVDVKEKYYQKINKIRKEK